MLLCSVYLYCTASLNKAWFQVLKIADGYYFMTSKYGVLSIQATYSKEQNNGMFTMGERSKSKQKFGGTKVWEAEQAREYFINP